MCVYVLTIYIIGTDLMTTDRRGNTPLHLAFSRLRVLNKAHTSPPLIRKIEIENVSYVHSCVYTFILCVIDNRHVKGILIQTC